MSVIRAHAALEALLDPSHEVSQAEVLVGHFGGLRRLLASPRRDLRAAGLSLEAARRISAVRELAQALLRGQRPRKRALLDARAVAELLPHLAWHPVEEVWLVPLDRGARPLGRVLIARGGAASCAIFPSEVLSVALRCRARSIYLLHNHPSGDPTPSEEDVRFTEKLVTAARLIGVQLEDHVVVGGGRYAAMLARKRGALRLDGLRAQRWKRKGTLTRFSLPWKEGT